MEFSIKVTLGNEVVSEFIIDVGMLELPGIQGRTHTYIGGFKVEWEMLDTLENNKVREEFLEQYPTRESFYGV